MNTCANDYYYYCYYYFLTFKRPHPRIRSSILSGCKETSYEAIQYLIQDFWSLIGGVLSIVFNLEWFSSILPHRCNVGMEERTWEKTSPNWSQWPLILISENKEVIVINSHPDNKRANVEINSRFCGSNIVYFPSIFVFGSLKYSRSLSFEPQCKM